MNIIYTGCTTLLQKRDVKSLHITKNTLYYSPVSPDFLDLKVEVIIYESGGAIEDEKNIKMENI